MDSLSMTVIKQIVGRLSEPDCCDIMIECKKRILLLAEIKKNTMIDKIKSIIGEEYNPENIQMYMLNSSPVINLKINDTVYLIQPKSITYRTARERHRHVSWLNTNNTDNGDNNNNNEWVEYLSYGSMFDYDMGPNPNDIKPLSNPVVTVVHKLYDYIDDLYELFVS